MAQHDFTEIYSTRGQSRKWLVGELFIPRIIFILCVAGFQSFSLFYMDLSILYFAGR